MLLLGSQGVCKGPGDGLKTWGKEMEEGMLQRMGGREKGFNLGQMDVNRIGRH